MATPIQCGSIQQWVHLMRYLYRLLARTAMANAFSIFAGMVVDLASMSESMWPLNAKAFENNSPSILEKKVVLDKT